MTTPLPPDHAHDDDLPGEAELKALYSRLPSSEPGPALDAAIRQAAAQAVREVTAPARTRRRPRWLIALGTAATVVLAAGLAWRMREMPTPQVTSPAPAKVSAAADAAGRGDAGVAANSGDAQRRALMAPTMKAVVTGKTRPATERTMPTARVAPARQAMKLQAPQPTTSLGRPDRIAPVPASPPATMLRMETRMPTADVPQASSRAAPVAPVAPAQPAPPAPPVAMELAAPAPTPAVVPAPAVVAPAVELDAIRALYARGEIREADKRLQAFHRTHPDWPLPDDLKRHLGDTP